MSQVMTKAAQANAMPSTLGSEAPTTSRRSKAKKSIDARLEAARIAIDAVMNDSEMQRPLSRFSYTLERMQQGKALLDNAEGLLRAQQVAFGDMFLAKDARDTAKQQAHNLYMQHVNVARQALKGERGLLQKLDLLVRRKTSSTGWIVQARQFYSAALNESSIQDKLSIFGLTTVVLEAGRQQIEEVEFYTVARAKTRGIAQDTTKQRVQAIEALDEWMREFCGIARFALKERPQLLEKLGLTVRA